MALLDSIFIVKLHCTYKDDKRIHFLLEPALGGDLFGLLETCGREVTGRVEFVCFLVACIGLGLQHMHTRHIIYRDLKPENVLLDYRGYFKICDFGLAKLAIKPCYTLCGTPEYIAPEVLQQRGYDKVADWW